MNEVVKFLQENPVQYLATVGRDGKAKCRPFMFAGELDGKLWFCTNNTKDVYKDMQANPNIEVSVSSPSYAWIRLHGEAVFENNMAAKEMCIQNPIVKGQYGEASSPTSPATRPGSTTCKPDAAITKSPAPRESLRGLGRIAQHESRGGTIHDPGRTAGLPDPVPAG